MKREHEGRGGDSVRERVRSVYESVREIKCVSLRNREREYVCVCV